MLDKFVKIATYTLVFLVALETVAAILSPTLALATFPGFAAFVNGFVLYYYQTRGNI